MHGYGIQWGYLVYNRDQHRKQEPMVAPAMHANSMPPENMTVLGRFVARSGLAWHQLAVLAGVLLLAMQLGALLLDKRLAEIDTVFEWEHTLHLPLLAMLLLILQHPLEQAFGRVLDGYTTVLKAANDEVLLVIQRLYYRKRFLELVAIASCALVGVVIAQPWGIATPWLRAQSFIAEAVVAALIGWFIYNTAMQTLLIRLLRGMPRDDRRYRALNRVREPLAIWGRRVLMVVLVLFGLTLLAQGTAVLSEVWFVVALSLLVLVMLIATGAFSTLMASVYQARILYALALVAMTALIGATGYTLIEGWSFVDALYMTVITMTTIGYGEIHPLSEQGRIFTIVLAVLSIGIGGYALSTAAVFLLEGEINQVLRGSYMNQRIARLREHIILCGAGRIGRHVAAELLAVDVPFLVVDQNQEVLRDMHDSDGILGLEGNATEDKVLRASRIEYARGLIAALGDDKDNVFLVLSARSLNPELYIVARLNEEENEEKFLRAGADKIVSPNILGGRRLASLMVRPSMMSFMDGILEVAGNAMSLEEIAVDRIPSLVNRTLSDAGIGQRIGLLVLAIKSAQGQYQFNPKGQTVLGAGDTLVVMGTQEQLAALHALEVH